MSVPTVGRIVHFGVKANPSAPLKPNAAIITAVDLVEEKGIAINQECFYKVSLVVFTVSGYRFIGPVPYSREPMEDHWSWPPIAVGVKI